MDDLYDFLLFFGVWTVSHAALNDLVISIATGITSILVKHLVTYLIKHFKSSKDSTLK